MDSTAYQDLLKPVFAGRRVILAGGVVAEWTATVPLVRDLGATDVLVIGPLGTGAGPLPDPAEATIHALPAPPATSMLDGIHAGLARLHDPPAELVDAVRRFDPRQDALVIGGFLTTIPELDGRPLLAHRRTEWVALEDKTVVDAFWDRVGVERAPSLTVPAERSALLEGTEAIATDAGWVWSGDAREGFNGGAEFVRWVRTSAEADNAVQFFAEHCDRVRVMPFLDGVPCSIHGIVFPDHVVALRPVEMVTLRHPADAGSGGLFYAGCATFYDPPAPVREQMRAIARSVGAALRAEVGFRGAFTVDGAVTDDRFLPTELNPRMGAGLTNIARGLPDLPLQLLLDALVGEVDLGYDPVEFEADLLAAADAHRSGGTWREVTGATVEPRTDVPLAFDGEQWRWAARGDTVAGMLTTGPGASGAFLRCTFDAATPSGPSVGERAAAFWAFADRELGTGVGPLTAAVCQCGTRSNAAT